MERLTVQPKEWRPIVAHANERTWNAIYDRLAAYEDTRLTPEEVAELARAKANGRPAEWLENAPDTLPPFDKDVLVCWDYDEDEIPECEVMHRVEDDESDDGYSWEDHEGNWFSSWEISHWMWFSLPGADMRGEAGTT